MRQLELEASSEVNGNLPVPKAYNWESLTVKRGAELEVHYSDLLRELSHAKGVLGQIFFKSQNKIQDPACGTGGFFLAAYDFIANPANYSLDKDQKKFLKHKTFTNEEGEQDSEDLTYNRQDFWGTTSNKQLNFLQHIRILLKSDGHAAVVLPNNVLFFDNHPAARKPWTKEIWIYDFRTNIHFTLKKNPLKLEDLKDFVDCYCPGTVHKRKETYSIETNPEGRWRRFTYDDIASRDKTSLDLSRGIDKRRRSSVRY